MKATKTVAKGLTEQGRRALLHFITDNVKDSTLIHLLAGWESDVTFETDNVGHIEIRQFYTNSHNPATRQFSGDEVELEEIEVDSFRAAYMPGAASGTGGGTLLTTEEDAGLPDDELIASAMACAKTAGIEISESDIVIGEWRD